MVKNLPSGTRGRSHAIEEDGGQQHAADPAIDRSVSGSALNDQASSSTSTGISGSGLADASLVVLADQAGIHDLLTLDERHFRTVTSIDGAAFRLPPADG
jgi:hypothetical protein